MGSLWSIVSNWILKTMYLFLHVHVGDCKCTCAHMFWHDLKWTDGKFEVSFQSNWDYKPCTVNSLSDPLTYVKNSGNRFVFNIYILI